MEWAKANDVNTPPAQAYKITYNLFYPYGRNDIVYGFTGDHKLVEVYSESTKSGAENQ